MDIHWEPPRGWKPDRTASTQEPSSFQDRFEPEIRLDALLPSDAATGVASLVAVRAYLDAMMQLAGRTCQPLALIYIAPDRDDFVRGLGAGEAELVGRAMARCLRQETRLHDVVGRADEAVGEAPQFFVVCPLMGETKAALLAERLRCAMTTDSSGQGGPSLSISIGVAALSIDVANSADLVARAESSLQNARRLGGGCVWTHSDTLRRIAGRDEGEPERE